MVHLELNAIRLDTVCDFFQYPNFDRSCGVRKGGTPLMVIHGDNGSS